MDLLCDRVGATGETVGVDNEARMIAMARDVAAEL
jgi:ubiquinone/menaquinone biosynthesis C-methylase UbiE